MRMCCVCRRRLPKAGLDRYVRNAGEGAEAFTPDPRKTMPGRGLYVCGQEECRERFLRRGVGRKKR